MLNLAELEVGKSSAAPIGSVAAAEEPPINVEKVARAARDLEADYRRQHGSLTQAQFDRLVLRRNLSPFEMVALLSKLGELDVTVTGGEAEKGYDGSRRRTSSTNTSSGTNTAERRGKNPYALLTRTEEVDLGRRIQLALRVRADLDASKAASEPEREIVERGLSARERMTVANLRLVNFAIRNLRRPIGTMDTFDLFQEGAIGLMRAVEKFDPELGLHFSTYAMWWIRQAILRGLDDAGKTIRLPVHRLESIRRMKVVSRRLAHEHGREATIRELADGLNWPLEKTLFMQGIGQLDCISMDTPIGIEGDWTIGDLIESHEPGPYEVARDLQRSRILKGFLDRLTPKQRLVITRRFGLGNSPSQQTLQQLGDQLGVTRERIRQIEDKALHRLKRWITRRMHDALM